MFLSILVVGEGLCAWKLFDITCTYYNQMRVFIAEDSYLIRDIKTWHIDFIKKIHNRCNHTLVACFPPYTQEHWRTYFGWLHRMEHLAFASFEEQQKVYDNLGRWNVFLPYCYFLNCFCVPFILNLNPFAFVNWYFWNLIVFPSTDFGNRNNFLIFHSSASYVIMKIQYLFSFLQIPLCYVKGISLYSVNIDVCLLQLLICIITYESYDFVTVALWYT